MIRTTHSKGCIVMLEDRKSQNLLAQKVQNVSSEAVAETIKAAFDKGGIHPKTIVLDNLSKGKDFGNTDDSNLEIEVSLPNNSPRKCLGIKIATVSLQN